MNNGVAVIPADQAPMMQYINKVDFERRLAVGGLMVMPEVANKWWPLAHQYQKES